MSSKSISNIFVENSKEGELYQKLTDAKVRCFACAHRCLIAEGKTGHCRMRINKDGTLYVPSGYVAGLQDDPIEKKPFFHVLPGSRTLSFGMLGCNFHCSFCQNWTTSQVLEEQATRSPISKISAGEIIKLARQRNCDVVTSTYNEPLITSEWAVEIFKEAKKAGLMTAYVSNGHATPEVLDYLKLWLDCFKVDLKCFDEKHYRELGGSLNYVCETICGLHDRGFWIEIVTLLVPGFNDSEDEIKKMCEFIVSVSPNIPWHVTAFHPDYQMVERCSTSPEDLLRSADIGKKAGIHYVYAGNLPGMTGNFENTYCPKCCGLLVERRGFQVIQDNLGPRGGKCVKCGRYIPGVWVKNQKLNI